MALSAVTPIPNLSGLGGRDEECTVLADAGAETRVNLTRPPDNENELIKVAAIHGPPGIFAVLRARRNYGWFVSLGLRAIEVCLGPRHPGQIKAIRDCDPIKFALLMLEMEVIEDVFELMRYYDNLKDVQRAGLSIIELLVMDDTEWRDEVARKGGVTLLCDIAKQRRDSPSLMCPVMACIAYLAAEDYIEVMLCQHDALEYTTYAMRKHVRNSELMTRASLALLNLTACEPHVEELMDKGAIPFLLEVFDEHSEDVHLVIIICGILANLSVLEQTRRYLYEQHVFTRVHSAMKLDQGNPVLQVSCLKALVNYSTTAEYYMKMEELEIPALVGQVMVDHGDDPGVQKYGNYFLGLHTSCPIV